MTFDEARKLLADPNTPQEQRDAVYCTMMQGWNLATSPERVFLLVKNGIVENAYAERRQSVEVVVLDLEGLEEAPITYAEHLPRKAVPA